MMVKPRILPDYHRCRLTYGIHWTPRFVKQLAEIIDRCYR